MSMSPEEFEKLIEDLSPEDIISTAVDCGLIKKRNIRHGDEIIIPRWLADILARHGVVEYVEAST
jgi:hypothetical protein